MQKNKDSSSYRDPSGYIFYENGKVYRAINHSYQKNYELFHDSGLYDELIEKQMIISYKEVNNIPEVYKVVQPELIEFISYPYEWSFNQLKDVALRLLEIQKIALNFNMTLKDATPYNFQFINNNPVLIDTLSFESYTEGQIWKPYKQFCEMLLSPLLLAKNIDPRLLRVTSVFKDGTPLEITSKLLPIKTKLTPSIALNIHAHAKSQKKYEGKKIESGKKLPRNSFLGIITSLESLIKNLTIENKKTEWSDYYEETNYTDSSFNQKQIIVRKFLDVIKPKIVLDLGSNTGVFSKIAYEFTNNIIACDTDHESINRFYITCKKENNPILPLILDITNPSSSIGWMNKERNSFFDRIKPDTVLALALIHHLAIANNIPLDMISKFFSDITDNLIIEFIPKSDSQIQRMLSSREDIFNDYDMKNFEETMSRYFDKISMSELENSDRILYYFRKKP